MAPSPRTIPVKVESAPVVMDPPTCQKMEDPETPPLVLTLVLADVCKFPAIWKT